MIPGTTPESGLLTLEERRPTSQGRKQLKIGIPKEVRNEERRVAITPSGVAVLASSGHEVVIESDAGLLANYTDHEYSEQGAEIATSASSVYGQCDLIAKVAPPGKDERALLRDKQILISSLNLGGATAEYFKDVVKAGITGIGYEFIKEPDGTFSIVRMMHEIMGSMSVQIAARYLESSKDGRGIMLGGISGVPPANVVIVGAGVIGEWAARTAIGFGARVNVLDNNLARLRSLEHYLDRRVTTAMANQNYLSRAVAEADVLIGAIMESGDRSRVLVTEHMIQSMRPGSVVVDLVVDQGGCIETSRPTSLSDPTFVKHDVIHYCVPNVPSSVPRTASHALANVLVPYIIDIGEAGSINQALWSNAGLRNGTYSYRGHLTKKNLAGLFGMTHRDIELLIASGI